MSKKWFWLTTFVLLLSLGGTAFAELMVHWRLDEGSGTTVYDSSGNDCDGTFNGEPQWVAGYLSAGALQFDGVDDFVVYSMPETQDLDAFTIALWVKAETLQQPSEYCSPFTGHYPNSDGFQIDIDAGNYRINPGGILFGPVTTDWVHLAIAAEGTSAQLYYNGEFATTGSPDGRPGCSRST